MSNIEDLREAVEKLMPGARFEVFKRDSTDDFQIRLQQKLHYEQILPQSTPAGAFGYTVREMVEEFQRFAIHAFGIDTAATRRADEAEAKVAELRQELAKAQERIEREREFSRELQQSIVRGIR